MIQVLETLLSLDVLKGLVVSRFIGNGITGVGFIASVISYLTLTYGMKIDF